MLDGKSILNGAGVTGKVSLAGTGTVAVNGQTPPLEWVPASQITLATPPTVAAKPTTTATTTTPTTIADDDDLHDVDHVVQRAPVRAARPGTDPLQSLR